MLSLFQQVGPAKINENLDITSNNFSWTSRASMIFLDQPVNTGFSFGSGRVNTTADAAKDVYSLMTLFFQQFPQYAKQDFHVAGSSYSGHYVPAIAAEILSHQDRIINLKSTIIGDGITDSLVQNQFFQPMACGQGGVPAVVDNATCQAMKAAMPECQALVQSCYDTDETAACVKATSVCDKNLLDPVAENGANIYNLRQECQGDTSNFCTDSVPPIDKWLNKPEVLKTLGVGDVGRWEVCSEGVSADFSKAGDASKPLQRQAAKALEQIPMLVYAGDGDFICSWLGNQAWTNALDWSGHDAFNSSQPQALRANGSAQDYGEIKAANGLAFVRIFNAGHCAALDQPAAMFDLFSRWMAGEWASVKSKSPARTERLQGQCQAGNGLTKTQ